jgi:hypothetical protein
MSGVLVYATHAALRQAERLLPDRVLELEVERAILAGRKRPYLPPGLGELGPRERSVFIAGGHIAVVLKGKARLSDRRAWQVLRLIANRSPRRPVSPPGATEATTTHEGGAE